VTLACPAPCTHLVRMLRSMAVPSWLAAVDELLKRVRRRVSPGPGQLRGRASLVRLASTRDRSALSTASEPPPATLQSAHVVSQSSPAGSRNVARHVRARSGRHDRRRRPPVSRNPLGLHRAVAPLLIPVTCNRLLVIQREVEIEHLISEKDRWKALYMSAQREQMNVAKELKRCVSPSPPSRRATSTEPCPAGLSDFIALRLKAQVKSGEVIVTQPSGPVPATVNFEAGADGHSSRASSSAASQDVPRSAVAAPIAARSFAAQLPPAFVHRALS
jgi:hypothetical protein